MIGRTPVGWMLNLEYVYVICAAFCLNIQKKFETAYHYFCLILLDLSFTLIGIEKGISGYLHPVVFLCCFMTACFEVL
jgi:uncharacterized membrane protein YeiH